MGKLDNKVAIVTGAGSGMGRASAVLFAQEGAKVVLADVSGRQEDAARAIGGDAVAVHCDVSQVEDVKAMIATAVSTFGKLDILFNNAGVTGPHALLHETDDDAMDKLYGVNLRGVFLGMKYAIPHMLDNGGGSIISTASAMALVGRKDQAAYGGTKGGVVAMTRNAAVDYGPHNIRVNAICPGMVYTGLAGAKPDAHVAPDSELPVPLGRWGLSHEIATAALFLASDDSSFITGVALPVDGGYTAQ